MLLNLLGGMMGGAETADGQPTEEYTKFMEDFKKGFNAGYDASTLYGQRTAPQTAADMVPLNPVLSFFFASNSTFSMFMACNPSLSLSP